MGVNLFEGNKAKRVADALEGISQSIGNVITAEAVQNDVEDWLEENMSNPDSPPLDRSLSQALGAAPADLVGEIKAMLAFAGDLLLAIQPYLTFTNTAGEQYWNDLATVLKGTYHEYSVSWTGSNYTATSDVQTVIQNRAYSCTVAPDEGYALTSVTVTMGEESVTPTENLDGTYTISIASVTGDISIAVVSEAAP